MNRIHFLRACWSDIILVESDGRFGLIDTGFADAYGRIVSYLDSLGVKRLEWILITHFHKDHYGSLPLLLGRVPVGQVYMKRFSGLVVTDGSGNRASEEFNKAELVNCESFCSLARSVSTLIIIDKTVERVRLGDFDFRIFGASDAIREMYDDPASPYYRQIRFGENTNSIALFAELNGTAVYLGADANNEALEDPRYDRANARYARAIEKAVDLYKVPHHGCGDIFDDEVLTILRPRFSVVTNWGPTWNRRFSSNRDRLLAVRPDAQILCTDRCGYVFTLGPEGQLDYEEINRVSEILVQEVHANETEAFRKIRQSHLAEDGILPGGEEPVCPHCGECSRNLPNGNGLRMYYFVREGIRIGAAVCRMDGPEEGGCEIRDFWIFRPYRSQGAGHYCFEALEACCRAAGTESFRLCCEKPAVIRFWKAFGFTENEPDERGKPLFRLIAK